MAQYVAFLRGMNLGKRRIKNEELCECFEAMEFENVSAFLASGNIIFTTSLRSLSKIQTTIELTLRHRLAYEVPTFVRAAKQVLALSEACPFTPAELKNTSSNVQVALLDGAKRAGAERQLRALSSEADRLALHLGELFWLPTGGLSESAVKWKDVEKIVGGTTIRTQRTFTRLAKKL